MLIRTLALFTVLFSFGQSLAAQCPDLSQASRCGFPDNPFLHISGISQKTNENNITTYTITFVTSEDSETINIVVDGNAYPFGPSAGAREYTATCNNKTLTVNVDYRNENGSSDGELILSFIQQQDSHVKMELMLKDAGSGVSRVFQGFCLRKIKR